MSKIEKLLELYRVSEERLREQINSLEESSAKTAVADLLLQVQEIINELTSKAGETTSSIVSESYRQGSREAISSMVSQGIGVKSIQKSLKGVIHIKAVQAILDEAFYSILECSNHMATDVKQRIQDIVKNANQRSIIEGVSRRQATKDAIAEAKQSGITGMIAKNGTRIPAEKYMANVIQYHQRKAHVEGSINRMIDNNQDLVYVNYVGITCEHCAKYQGRVYSLSGKDKRFPRLETRPPYHSHCVHSTSPWIEEYMDEGELKQALKDSNRPFIDNRTEEHIREYERLQREKSKQNETRKQWIRYKSRMPDLPDLKTFASQKARNTKKYQEWMEDFRKFGIEIKKRGG
ncbi:minor capsid protein [Robertmurraya sp. DFI.2.37]|nr:phage minor capsid protein [Robertmurraya sp. DFI.2.37]MDF1510588.1 minor capsid protein [Robertmurraya sp. DFI.2.37]